jgi:hypothetical protein
MQEAVIYTEIQALEDPVLRFSQDLRWVVVRQGAVKV